MFLVVLIKTTYAVNIQTGTDYPGLVPDQNAGFACGSVVLAESFSGNFDSVSQNSLKKDILFHIAGNNIHCQM
ncbi:MAG: hypothetical protein ACLFVO_07475 [Chloroflexaceae bacterium]